MASTPLISFVLATFNRGSILVDCLRQLSACGLSPEQYEIIVTDNASTDLTAELVSQHLPHVTLIRLATNQGPVAKNHSLARATGQFILFLDDDAFPLPGAIVHMLRHFQDDPQLAAAVFDVILPDGSQECSAYPDVFIGAGTAFRKSVLEQVGGLPMEFFMQAEEYDLSFRILRAGHKIQRFADMPLRHLKAPNARIAHRTTQLDVRNNLYLLAKYVPAPLCFELAADWLARYGMMALNRDAADHTSVHRTAFMKGAAEGLGRWTQQRRCKNSPSVSLPQLLSEAVVEQIFKMKQTQARLADAQQRFHFSRILCADLGKNMLAYYRAAEALHVSIVAIADDLLAAPAEMPSREYRGVPLISWSQARALKYDAILVSNLSPVHARRRAAALLMSEKVPVLELFTSEYV